MIKNTLPIVLGAALLAGCATSSSKPAMSIEDIMNEGFKGKTSIAERMSDNLATEAEKMRMVYLTQQLAMNQPPKGSQDSWVEKTTTLNQAAVLEESRAPGAMEAWRSAADCKACHSVHKPK